MFENEYCSDASEKQFLLYCPTYKGDHKGEFFGDGRLFDVALNDFSGEGSGIQEADWQFAEKGHKWPCIEKNLKRISKKYEFYAFFDNDIIIDTESINTLFLVGYSLGLNLFQASLSEQSETNYGMLKSKPGSYVRYIPLVEIMMPIFSHEALLKCRGTFSETESGWGCDIVWSKLLDHEGLAIVDCVQATHTKPLSSHKWVLSNGKSAMQELEEMKSKYLS